MNTISQNIRYYPHDLNTKFYAVRLYSKGYPLSLFCRRHHVSKSSLLRWMKKFDGTKESLIDKSHRPLSKHPNAHTDEEIKWIKDYTRRNPHITLPELYGKLRTEKGYSRHACSLFRIIRKMNLSVDKQKHEKYIPKKYNTPKMIGIKWQMDVKYVPKECYVGNEASRERFIYPYKEQSTYSTIDFVKRAIVYFGYKPQIIQTDNGSEFIHTSNTKRIHPLDILCEELKIIHKLIKPRTPRHNGKVERSHRNDQQRFYSNLSFYSYDDLLKQMKAYLKRSNNIPMQVLNWMTPIEKREQLKSSANASLSN